MNVHHSVSHSRKTNGWNLKCTQFWKGKSSSKPPFVGSMSVYRSVCQPLLDSCIATTLTEGHSWFLSWVEQPLRPGHFVLGRWIPTFQQKLSQKVYPLGDAIFFCKTTQSWKFTMNYRLVHDVRFLTPSHQEPQATKNTIENDVSPFCFVNFWEVFSFNTHENIQIWTETALFCWKITTVCFVLNVFYVKL